MTSRYSNLHQRDRTQERTQLFTNVGPYNPSQVINSSSTSRSSTPYNRTATPDSHYSDAVLQQLESQNEEHIEGLSAKVKMLKDVCEDALSILSEDRSRINCGCPGTTTALN